MIVVIFTGSSDVTQLRLHLIIILTQGYKLIKIETKVNGTALSPTQRQLILHLQQTVRQRKQVIQRNGQLQDFTANQTDFYHYFSSNYS